MKKKRVKKKNIGISGVDKILRITGVCGILSALFFILIKILVYMPNMIVSSGVLMISKIIINILLIIFLYGFFILGRKYDNKLLRSISLIFIIVVLVVLLMNLFLIEDMNAGLNSKIGNMSINYEGVTEAQVEDIFVEIFPLITPLLLLGLSGIFIYSILIMIFGFGLKRLEDLIKFSKAAGILKIVTGGLLLFSFILFIVSFSLIFSPSYINFAGILSLVGLGAIALGMITGLVAFVLEIMILLNEF